MTAVIRDRTERAPRTDQRARDWTRDIWWRRSRCNLRKIISVPGSGSLDKLYPMVRARRRMMGHANALQHALGLVRASCEVEDR
jgi:hypothetical protein